MFSSPELLPQIGIYIVLYLYGLLLWAMSTKHLTPSSAQQQPHVLVGICVIVY